MTQPIKTIVVAVSRNGIIGREGDMPWRLSSDLKRFKEMTLGKPVIMGRKTFQSIGKPLPGRPNIIITRDTDFTGERITVAHSLDEAIVVASHLASESNVDEICIIGGGEIYRQAIGLADRLLVTHVGADVEGDTSFPDIDPGIWQADSELVIPAGEKDTYPTRFVRYVRRKA
ncbi:diacylglycerol kinase [Rhizobium sp. JAB6]|uniref:dihydrofolate reductase n=1 Tax=Rhizobium sp. JAB6 TaxID=2127050 RepID=UPI000D12C9BF|nr:dihydrofolate reductase [Rhizobium sp. JAB6]PST19182.1 diacylglycerol kinase [Rhizobium sp. JAB6]